MKPVEVEVRIEELVLHGFDPLQASAIRTSLEAELGRLLCQGELPEFLSESSQLPELRAGELRIGANARPTAIGAQIAQAIYQGFTR